MGEEGIADLALANRKWRDGAARVKANYEAWGKLVKKGIRKVKRRHYGELLKGMPGRLDKIIAKKGWRIKP